MNNQGKIEEQELIDLYNVGYGLYKYSPEMAELIDHIHTTSKKMEVLKSGIEKGKSEPEPAHLPDWLKKDRFRQNNKDIYRSKNKDIEPDKN